MRLRWLNVWVRLAPLWATLWLVFFLAPTSLFWVHLDGTVCDVCSRDFPSSPLHQACCIEPALTGSILPTQTAINHSLVSGLDCHHCCKAAVQESKTASYLGFPTMALLPRSVLLRVAFKTDEFVPDVRERQWAVSPSRAPPTGRAPPFEASFSLI